MAKIFFLGGILSDQEILQCAQKGILYDSAAHNFQKKFLAGFTQPVTLINAPFIRFHADRPENRVAVETDEMVFSQKKYLNIRYIGNVFKEYALAAAIEKVDFTDAIIFVYSIHTPFLKTVRRIKEKYPSAKFVQIVPDLPQFMNTSKSANLLYRVLKRVDMWQISRLLQYVDLFVPFTEAMMKDHLGEFKKPYYVMEGVYEERIKTEASRVETGVKKVVYTGTLNIRYGISKLLEAFSFNTDPTIKLIICGEGELRSQLELGEIPNVEYLGMLPYHRTLELIDQADLLVNPREGNELYTRYSFPSKIFDYLSSDKPILCFKLPGIPDEYDSLLYYFSNNEPKAMMSQIKEILETSPQPRETTNFLRQKTAKQHVVNILRNLK